MKRILITTGIFSPDIGGPATYARLIAQALSGKSFDVRVITYSSLWEYKNDKSLPFKVTRIWKKNFWFFRHAIYATKIFFAGRKSDIIYSLSTLNGSIPSLISSAVFRKKFYIRIAGDYAWQVAAEKRKSSLLINDFQVSKKNGWIRFLYWLQALLCKKADKIIVPSEYLKNLVQGWGIKGDKIQIIYNGVDFKKSELTKEEARKKISIPGNIILSSGRLVPWKGFRMLIKIMPKVLEINQFLRLIIIGDGPEMHNLQTIVRNMGLDRKVYLVGKKSKEDMAVYFAAADMFILNSGYEGFSHQILEAMAAGVPVIASAMGGNKEVIEQGKNGFLVRYNDEFNIVEAIKGLHKSSELKEEFTIEGIKTVEKYSLERMTNETLALLTK